MDYTYTDRKLVLSERMNRVKEQLEGRIRRWGDREMTRTGAPFDGKTPFLDAFEELPDAPYPVALAEGIVRSWIQTDPVIYPDEIIVGVNRPRRFIYEHFSWGLDERPDIVSDSEYASMLPVYTERLNKIRSRIFPGSLDPMNNKRVEYFGEASEAVDDGLWWTGGYQGHTVPSYEKLLRLGLDGTIEEINKYDANTNDDDKHAFYESLRIIVEGLSEFAILYADLAKNMAEKTDDAADRDRLLMIEKNCRSVAHKAPETLYEAVQLMWFYSLWDWVDCIGRGDQYLYRFYEKETDKVFREEIITSIMLKIREHGVHNFTLAGVKPEDGTDAANEMTYLCLQIARVMHDTHPRLSVRVDKSTPDSLLKLAVTMWSEGMSDPTLVSDTLVVPGLHSYGVSIKDARDYTMLGCQEIEIQGKSNFGCEDGSFNLGKVLEYTLNEGYDTGYNVRAVPSRGRMVDFKSIDEIWEAYKANIEYLTGKFCELCSLGQTARDANFAKLVKCVYTDDCIARGINMDGGGASYNYGVVETGGLAVVGDSFAALEKVVFEDKKVTLSELYEAMKANYEGYDDIRNLMLNAPKYGNDDDYADKWAVRVLDFFWTEIGKYKSVRGGVYMGACSLLEGGIAYGNSTGALPDGHRKGDPFGNTIGPRPGADKSGVTAMLKSVSKLPLHLGLGGTTVNTLIPVNTNETEEQHMKIVALFRAYLENGGQMAQITTATKEDMIDAKIHPELHENLIIRVGGYSAKFIEVDSEMQDELISRYA